MNERFTILNTKLASDDNELVEKSQKGDVEAFDSIYNKYSGKHYVFSLKYLIYYCTLGVCVWKDFR